MSALATPFRQLVERRLWPLALLLLVALAAVPMLLAKDPELPGPAAPIASSATTETASLSQPIVGVSEPAAREQRRRVLGKRKDPFRPAVLPKVQKADEVVTAPASKPAESTTTSGPGRDVVITPAGELAPKKVYELYSLNVRFGDSTAEKLGVRNLKRLTALPSVAQPVVIYLGLQKDLRTAVFLVDAAARVQGDGRCKPNPQNCQTVHMQPGETAFFDLDVGNNQVQQFQMDYIKVKRRKTTDAKAARRSRTAVASGGRDALRARSSRVGPYRYDPETGTIRTLSNAELKAEASARAARD